MDRAAALRRPLVCSHTDGSSGQTGKRWWCPSSAGEGMIPEDRKSPVLRMTPISSAEKRRCAVSASCCHSNAPSI
ncbi:uncharacterized [Tachysurus ichikawai]